MSLKASRTPSKIDNISRVLADLMMILMFQTGVCILDDVLDGLHSAHANAKLKNRLKSVEFKAWRTPSKIYDISRILALVDDDIDAPDWGWCHWWHYGWSSYALRELFLKFGWNLFNLKASGALSRMDDIAGGLEDAWRSWLGLMSLIMNGMCLWRSLESLCQFSWSSDD